MNRLKILSILPDFGPSSVLYAVKPFLFLQDEKRIRFKAISSRLPAQIYIDWADVVVFCRNSEDYDLRLLDYAKREKKKVIYNLDDNFFRIEPDTPLGSTAVGKLYCDPARIRRLREFISRADLVLVYSEHVLQDVRPLNGNVVLLKGYFDFSLTDDKIKRRQDPKIRITYATSRGRFDYLQPLITEAISYISKKYADSVEFDIFGSHLPVEGRNIRHVGLIKNYNRFIRRFFRTGCSIGLAPMEDDVFHRSKTDIKYREYGACRIAGIYSNVALYRRSVQDGINGLLVENLPDAWIAAMERLINDSTLRERIVENAYRDVMSNYSMADFCHRLLDAIQNLFLRRLETGNERDDANGRLSKSISTASGFTAREPVDVGFIAGTVNSLKKHGLTGLLGIVFRYLYLLFRDTITALRINYLKEF